MLGKQLTQAAAGAGGVEKLYVDDLFSVNLYTGTGAEQTITTGIDIAGEGGFVWIKSRSAARNAVWYDPEVGQTGTYYDALNTASTSSPNTGGTGGITSFSSDGFTIDGTQNTVNESGTTYVAWTFRKAPGFMTSVTYTGNGTAGRTVAHDLDSTPGMIIVKRLDAAGDWMVYHHGMGRFYALEMNDDDQRFVSSIWWNDTSPTSTDFTVGTNADVNGSGGEYIAYLFADDDQRFGDNSDESIIGCPSWSGDAIVSLGWEPQWLLSRVKGGHTDSQDWPILDSARGFLFDDYSHTVFANRSYAENSSSGAFRAWPQPYGFDAYHPYYGRSWMGLAIRRPKAAVPTVATDVFSVNIATDEATISSGFLPDMAIAIDRDNAANRQLGLRMMGDGARLRMNLADAKNTGNFWTFQQPLDATSYESDQNFTAGASVINYAFRHGRGFFTTMNYEGTGSARTVQHDLGVAPEMMIIKSVDANLQLWGVYHSGGGATDRLVLNGTNPSQASSIFWNNTAPTSTVFSLGTGTNVNKANEGFVALLFATLSGISKVGTYSGTGNNIDVDCGFTNGARFVLIKRTDSSGDWFVYDTERGINSGNDSYSIINSTAAEVTGTDYIDPLSAGFTVTSTAPADLNVSGGTYAFLAIA
jgi:hypothetical protein